MPRPITFLTDYGSDDEFAGVCRAVIARISPEARVIDLTHGIRRHDVAQGAAVLANALPYAPAGIHLAVVDPGVGGSRRAVAVAARAEGRVLVGPDNGLLWPALERFGGAGEAVEVSSSPARLEPVSATFHGRDLFAPVAAALAGGAALGDVGDALDPEQLVRLERREPQVGENTLATAVAYVDRFGNAALAAGRDEAEEAGLILSETSRERGEEAVTGSRLTGIVVEVAAIAETASWVRTFADVSPGELLLHVDSYGSLALAVNQGSAAERLGLATGDEVTLRAADDRALGPR